MFLGILTLITALSISAVAIYYSVAGLMTIFAAAALPIMIMGGVLEIGKLVTAVWLHRYWSQATWWLKTYLTTAVVVLMFITSMGIFGFLSKAHIEQTASANEGIAQLERIETEIARQKALITRAEERILEARNSDNNRDAELQQQIDKEQERIDGAYARVQPAIDEQLATIQTEANRTEQRIQPVQSEVDTITNVLNDLQNAINTGDIEKAQGIVGTAVDGDYGPNTARAVEDFRAAQLARRDTLVSQIDSLRSAPNDVVTQARAEIQRLRSLAEQQIADSNTLIERLRSQLGQGETADVDSLVDEQTARITQANKTIDTLTEQRYTLESEYRKLEAEVGPVKYIAEFIYGERANTNLLEEAVRWVILIIIFVFDPLAVLLLIASQYTFELNRKRKDDQKELHRLQEWEEYERTRAKRIIDNPGYNTDDPTSIEEEEEVDATEEKEGSGNTTEADNGDRPTPGTDTGDTQSVSVEQKDNIEQTESEIDNGRVDIREDASTSVGTRDSGRDTTKGVALAGGELDDYAKSYITTNDSARDILSKTDTTVADAVDTKLEYSEVQTNEQDLEVEAQKKSLELPEESEIERERREIYEEKEKDQTFNLGKQAWKEANPTRTLKHYKNLYIKGIIDHLPWETLPTEDNYKEGERIKPDLTEVIEPEGYKQNGEQNENTLFNKLRNR